LARSPTGGLGAYCVKAANNAGVTTDQAHRSHRSAAMARQYYASKAECYQTSSQRGFWSVLRRIETPAVLALARVQRGERLLDAGCGAGHYTEALLGAGAEVTALDIEARMLSQVQERLGVATVQGDLATVRLEPVFDKVVCAGVLEFVADPAAALTNLARGLRPDGAREVVILVLRRCVAGVGFWLARRKNGISMPMLSKRELDALAARSGLRVDEVTKAGYNWVARLRPVDAEPRV
jgi:SAM-dependent methyltransferase